MCDGGDEGGAMANFNTSGSIYAVPDWCEPYVDFKQPVECIDSSATCSDSPQYQIESPMIGYPGKEDPESGQAISTDEMVRLVQLEIMTNGPVGMSIGANDAMSNYQNGVISNAGEQEINHAVTLIGWGTDTASGIDYWVCQNSWGKDWGEEGRFRIARGRNELNCEVSGFSFETPTPPTTSTQGCISSLSCQNGGEPKSDCSCQCNGPYTGTNCETCNLDCGANGALNQASCDCTCNSGYFGKQCEKAFFSKEASYAADSPTFLRVVLEGVLHVGDQFLVDNAGEMPTSDADVTEPCPGDDFPFVDCTASSGTYQAKTTKTGTLQIWIRRALGLTELGTDKGFSLDADYTTPTFTVQ